MRGAFGLAVLLLAAGCGPSEQKAAEPAHSQHSASDGGTPAQREYDTAMAEMHRTMGKAGANPDESFMRMMIPHHRGAVAMAEIELRHGKDPEARRLAERVLAAQRGEIAEMEAWLAKRAPR